MSPVAVSTERILLLGAIASGKTVLSRRISSCLSIPIIHVDTIEFNRNLTKKSIESIRSEIKDATSAQRWILDGHGPLDLLPSHLKNANIIIFLEFPLWLNIYFLFKRQIVILVQPRKEMPKGAKEWRWSHFKKMVQTLLKQHRLMNPELIRILEKPENKQKLIHVKTIKTWKELFKNLIFQPNP